MSMRRPRRERPRDAGDQVAGVARSMRVVVVEDDAPLRAIHRPLLTLAGFDVRVCATAEEALLAMREDAPDAVVTDVELPFDEGRALARTMRTTDHLARVPIIAMAPAEMHSASLRDFDVVLRKPRAFELLVDVLTHIGAPRRAHAGRER